MARSTIIGVDLGGTKVAVGRVTGSSVDNVATRRVPNQEAAEVVLAVIVETIREIFDTTVIGIGCGVPSVVDVEAGVVFNAENIPSWKRFGLKAALEEEFGVPVYVNNDANAFAVGEYIFGAGRGVTNMVGMTLGTGLGTGVIIDGHLYCGSNCGAGEIGMMRYRGLTLEDYCAGPFFERDAGVRGEVVYGRARSGDAESLAVFERYGGELAQAVMIALYAYDPDVVVFGGSISSAFDLFEPGLRRGLEEFAYRRVVERLVICRSELEHSALLGAAALYVDATTR